VRKLVLIHNPSILQLNIEILIDREKSAPNRQIVLQLHCHLLSHQLLEVREEQLHNTTEKTQKISPEVNISSA
jgi:hypothetical protein